LLLSIVKLGRPGESLESQIKYFKLNIYTCEITILWDDEEEQFGLI